MPDLSCSRVRSRPDKNGTRIAAAVRPARRTTKSEDDRGMRLSEMCDLTSLVWTSCFFLPQTDRAEPRPHTTVHVHVLSIFTEACHHTSSSSVYLLSGVLRKDSPGNNYQSKKSAVNSF